MPVRRSYGRKRKTYGSYKKRTYGAVRGTVAARRSKYARKRTYRKRVSYRKKRSGFSSFVVDPRSKLFPERKYCTLVYQNESFILAPGLAKAAAVHTWRAANLRDPNLTGVGHQPMYYDPMMLLYQYYIVLESKIECVFASGAGGDTNSYHCGVAVRPDIAESTSSHRYAENGGCKSAIFNYNMGTKTLSLTYYPGKTLGFNDSPMNHPELQGNNTIDPAQVPTFQVYANSMNSALGADVFVTVKIQYKCVFFHPLYQAPNMNDPETYPSQLSSPEEDMVSVGHDNHPTSLMGRMGLA